MPDQYIEQILVADQVIIKDLDIMTLYDANPKSNIEGITPKKKGKKSKKKESMW